MAQVTLRNVCKSFGDIETIHNVDLDIEKGDLCVFVGPSGCGKSTILRLIAGLEEITSGDLSMGGRRVNDLPPAERSISMVFQSYALYPHMNVFRNMAFGLKIAKKQTAEINEKVNWASNILGLNSYLDAKPKSLSGGQRQRVAIGRAIVRNPDLFLFDEPLSNLDAALRVQTRMEIAQLHRKLGSTMVYVTHDQVEAMTLATRMVVLRAGRIEQVGKPMDLFRRPCNKFVAGFIGSPKMNFLAVTLISASGTEAVVRDQDGTIHHVSVDASQLSLGIKITLGVRPERLDLVEATDDNTIKGTVLMVERLGDQTLIHTETSSSIDHCIARLPAECKVELGDTVYLKAKSHHYHLFDSDEQACHRLLADETQADTNRSTHNNHWRKSI